MQQQEELYREHPEMREGQYNGKMPWSEYKEIITYMLPKYTGMYELSKVLAMERESEETVKSWCQWLNKGRRRVGKKMGCFQPQRCLLAVRSMLSTWTPTTRKSSTLMKAG